MSETKQNKYTSLLAEREPSRAGVRRPVAGATARNASKGGDREVTTWDAYNNWLTKVQAPELRRSVPDPALFSFKGYRSWAEKIRRDWETED